MPDVCPGGSNLGLTELVESYFDQQNEARRKHDTRQVCPGEEVCEENGTPTGKKGLRDKSKPIEDICDGCELKHTKPGSMPTLIAPLLVTARRMEALFESGAGAPYPDVFTPLEWEAFLALLYSRAKDYEKDMEQPPKPATPPKKSPQQELEERMRRG